MILHYSYMKVVNGKFNIWRTESDFSIAIINAILISFQCGPIVTYLTTCWNDVTCNITERKITHHVCSWHTRRFLKKAFEKAYKSRTSAMKEDILKRLKKWSNAFLNSSDLNGFCNRARQIIIITGRKHLSPDVEDALEGILKRTPHSGKTHLMSYIA